MEKDVVVRRVLITGMSGTGKSSVIAALQALGYRAVDVDEGGYSHLVSVPEDDPTGLDPGTDWVWCEDAIERLMVADDGDVLFIGGCAPNQGRFYAQFDHIILLSASEEVMVQRLTTRTTNPYGSRPEDVERSLQMKALIEPLLRASADLEIDTNIPLDDVVAAVLRHVADGP